MTAVHFQGGKLPTGGRDNDNAGQLLSNAALVVCKVINEPYYELVFIFVLLVLASKYRTCLFPA